MGGFWPEPLLMNILLVTSWWLRSSRHGNVWNELKGLGLGTPL